MFATRMSQLSARTMSVKTVSARSALGVVLVASAFALSGCGGTTYGTGVTQEEQTFKDMYGILSLSKQRTVVDDTPRAELIVPQNKAQLPEPLDESATTSNPAWPESPEDRIARVRSEAGEIDARTGDYSVEDQLRKKEGIGIETQEPKGKFVAGKTDRDGNPLLNLENNQEARKKVIEAKSGQSYDCANRKYLTEPPPEYCITADTAPVGEAAFDEGQIEARQEAAEIKKKNKDGITIPSALQSRD